MGVRRPLVALGTLALAGCVSVPRDHRTLLGDPGGRVRVASVPCGAMPPAVERAAGAAGLDARGFRVLTWNVHRGGGPGWGADFARFAGTHDVLALQEARGAGALPRVLRDEGYHWRMSASFRLRDVDIGVLTAARAPMPQACAIREVEPFIRIPKSVLVTTHRLVGVPAPLLVANLHGVNFTVGTRTFERQLAATATELSAHVGPLVLVGDFNTWSGPRRAALQAVTAALGLVAVVPADDQRVRVGGHPIDGMYYRDLEVVTATTFAVGSSDHNPMSVTFRVPGRQAT